MKHDVDCFFFLEGALKVEDGGELCDGGFWLSVGGTVGGDFTFCYEEACLFFSDAEVFGDE